MYLTLAGRRAMEPSYFANASNTPCQPARQATNNTMLAFTLSAFNIQADFLRGVKKFGDLQRLQVLGGGVFGKRCVHL